MKAHSQRPFDSLVEIPKSQNYVPPQDLRGLPSVEGWSLVFMDISLVDPHQLRLVFIPWQSILDPYDGDYTSNLIKQLTWLHIGQQYLTQSILQLLHDQAFSYFGTTYNQISCYILSQCISILSWLSYILGTDRTLSAYIV